MWAFRWSGKASRGDWWTVWLVSALVVDLAAVVSVISLITNPDKPNWPFIAAIAVGCVALWPTFAVTAQRFRDRGESPWLTLFHLVPVIGWGWIIVACGVLPNTNYETVTTRVRRSDGEAKAD